MRFITERFEPLGHLALIVSFYFACVSMAGILSAESAGGSFTGLFLVILIFFHLRLFDEIKDYHEDCRVNRERPLPRGLIGLDEFRLVTLLIITLEVILALVSGRAVFVTYVILLAFTLLMRLEFFIGGYLRPRMELYAVTHTFSAFFITILILSMHFNKDMGNLIIFREGDFRIFNPVWLLFPLSNWLIFNIFEFARKTYAPEEEKEGIDSYSRRRGIMGAFLLVAVNSVMAIISIYVLLSESRFAFTSFLPLLLLTVGLLVAGSCYVVRKDVKSAIFYRRFASLYLVLYNIFIITGCARIAYHWH